MIMSQLLAKLLYYNSRFYVNYSEVIAKNSFQQAFLATNLNNGDSWNCWTCQHHLTLIGNVHKHAIRPKNHDIMRIISIIRANYVILQPYLATILENGNNWNFWGFQYHLKLIPNTNKHIFRHKNHDHVTIISKIIIL